MSKRVDLELIRRLHFYLNCGMNIQDAMQMVLQDAVNLEELFGGEGEQKE